MVVPVYNAEMAPKSLRGRLVALNQLFITAGIMVSIVYIPSCSIIIYRLVFVLAWLLLYFMLGGGLPSVFNVSLQLS